MAVLKMKGIKKPKMEISRLNRNLYPKTFKIINMNLHGNLNVSKRICTQRLSRSFNLNEHLEDLNVKEIMKSNRVYQKEKKAQRMKISFRKAAIQEAPNLYPRN